MAKIQNEIQNISFRYFFISYILLSYPLGKIVSERAAHEVHARIMFTNADQSYALNLS